jgi:hypothetical protein
MLQGFAERARLAAELSAIRTAGTVLTARPQS